MARLWDRSQDTEPEVFDVWLESQVGLAQVHYWQDEPDKLAALFAVVGPAFKANGEPRHRQADYLGALLLWQLAERRHRVDNEVLDTARKGLAAAREFPHSAGLGGNLPQVDIGWKVINVGLCLLWYGDLDGAKNQLTEALRIAARVGSVAMRAEAMSYLNLAALRGNDPDAVAVLAPQAIETAHAAAKPQYVATAKASLAWMAWKTGRLAEVEALAEHALECWRTTTWQPYHWVCLWPLIGVRLAAGQVAEAVGAARQLLPAPQQRLPDELEDVMQSAIAAWDHGEPERAADTLTSALELAQRLRFA